MVFKNFIKRELYDTGYTERYMSTPELNEEGYKLGSVMNYIDNFPDESNRLLIIHGSADENVHFKHTECLINSLINEFKNFQISIYPNERHGIRNSNSIIHFTKLLFDFINLNIKK
jgi:dipeptidyl-peptidase 9